MHFSIIIPTRNRSKLLYSALDSITKQSIDHDSFEVIIIDNGSTDATRETALSFENKIKNIRYIYETKPGLHVGRNMGLRVSDGDVLVYIDDDVRVFPTWLEGIKESFTSKNVVMVGGKVLPEFEIAPPKWIGSMWMKRRQYGQVLGYLSLLDFGDKVMEIDPQFVFGCNFSILKTVLIKAEGFHPDAMPEKFIQYRGDGETYVAKYMQTNGYRALYNPKALVYHYVSKSRMTEQYFCKRAFLQGISDSYTFIRGNHGYKNDYNIFKKWAKLFAMMAFNRNSTLINIRKAYLRGYSYHSKEVRKDPVLLQWVLKEDYLN